MKKRILFVSHALGKGGSAKALIALLEKLDYDKADVTLKLLAPAGTLRETLPQQVKVSYQDSWHDYSSQLKLAWKKHVFWIYLIDKFLNFFHISHGHAFYQKIIDACLEVEPEDNAPWDIAVAASELLPTYYVAKQVTNAKKKASWLHSDYQAMKVDAGMDQRYYDKMDTIVTVNMDCAKSFCTVFPEYRQKTMVIENIIPEQSIRQMAEKEIVQMDGGLNIITVSRLDLPSKRMDRAVRVCRRLLDAGIPVKWYYIGDGPDRKKTERLIKKYHLTDRFLLLGEKDNPYSYMRQADLFVLLSQYEGKPLVITEAMLLGCPVAVTEYRSAKEQVPEKWGYIIPNREKGLEDAVLEIVGDTAAIEEKKNALKSYVIDNRPALKQIDVLLDF